MRRVLTVLFILLIAANIGAQNPAPPKPDISRGLVLDYTNTLSPSQLVQLNNKLIAYDDSTSNQIAVVIIRNLKGNPDSSLVYPIEDVALKILRDWGVGGQAKKDNGIVLLVAIEDRRVRIETGYGLEGAIPDMTAASIIDHDIVPHFKKGDYYSGLDAGTTAIMEAARGEYTAPEGYAKRKKGKSKGIGFNTIIVILVILFILFRKSGGGGGMVSRRGYRGWLGPTFPGGWGGGGWSGGGGGWSGGGGGGGFGGFGGGSGGGGGASGSW